MGKREKLYNKELGDIEEVFEKNRKITWSIVEKYFYRAKAVGLDKEDIFSVAKEGFIKAYRDFDTNKFKNVKFSTYAYSRMVGEINVFLRDYNYPIKFTRKVKEISYEIRRRGLEEYGEEVIAEILGESADNVYEALILINNRVPLHTGGELYSSVKSKEPIKIEDILYYEDDETTLCVKELLELMEENNRIVATLMMMGLNQSEVVKRSGITIAYVRNAIKELKEITTQWFGWEKSYITGRKTKLRKEGFRKEVNGNDNSKRLAIRLLKNTECTIEEIAKVTGLSETLIRQYEYLLETG